MKKLQLSILLVFCLLLFIGCTDVPQPVNTTTATALSTAPNETMINNEEWFQKIKLNYDAVWSMPVIETSDGFYYLTDDGIYQYIPGSETDTKISSEVAYGLFMFQDQLFFNSGNAIKKIRLENGEISTVWEKDMLSSLPEISKRYISICDFQIHNGFLYLAITGTCAIRVSLETGVAEMFLDDFGQMVIVGEDCYYIDHAHRTFSLYHMNIGTKEISLLRGQGYSEPNTDVMRVDSISFVDNNLYYCVRDTSELFQYHATGADKQIVVGNKEQKINICFVERNTSNTMYYYITDGAQLKLYAHSSYGGDDPIMSMAFEGRLCDIVVTNSAIFYTTYPDSVVQCIKR